MTRLNGTTFPAGPDPYGLPVPPQLPPSFFLTQPAAFTIEAEGVKVSAPYEADALRMFKRVRAAMRRRELRAARRQAGE